MTKSRRMPPASWMESADVDAVVPLALERGRVISSIYGIAKPVAIPLNRSWKPWLKAPIPH
ncbi:MAG: hypothetical protein ACXWF8_18815 [Methylobacter sp.]